MAFVTKTSSPRIFYRNAREKPKLYFKLIMTTVDQYPK